MKFLLSTCLLLVQILATVAVPAAQNEIVARAEVLIHYKCCPNPGQNISVINFEYTEGQKLYDHHGLMWKAFSGYKRYYGHPDGWAPIPSNYTTAHVTWDGQSVVQPTFGTGPRAKLSRVHSFWFYLGFIGYAPGTLVPIKIIGTGPGIVPFETVIYTDPYDDGVWEHVCLDWAPVEHITFVLPSCLDRASGQNCKQAIFELDDIWVQGGPLKPYGVPTPKIEFD